MKVTERQLRRLIKEERAKLLKEQFAGDPGSTASKMLDNMVDGLERKLLSMRLDEDEVDSMLVELMQVVGTDVERLLVKLLEGGYREDF